MGGYWSSSPTPPVQTVSVGRVSYSDYHEHDAFASYDPVDNDDDCNYDAADPWMPYVVCGKDFLSPTLRSDHVRLMHPELLCDVCGTEFSSVGARNLHVESMHSVPSKCSVCGKNFYSVLSRDRHMECVHSETKFVCLWCRRIFRTESSRDQHIATVHVSVKSWAETQRQQNSKKQQENKQQQQQNNKTTVMSSSVWANDQHVTYPHPHIQCTVCSKVFSSARGRDQHVEAVHPMIECPTCEKTFGSTKALDQHVGDAHGKSKTKRTTTKRTNRRGQLDVSDLTPPVNSPGEWVPRDGFNSHKSFGAFQCTQCRKRWYSAHAFPKYTQGCQRCETKCLPKFLWVNWDNDSDSESDLDSESDEEVDDKPHDKARCGACRAGVCLNGISTIVDPRLDRLSLYTLACV
jgi:uncharacterized C2H2 Zn-finger protein